jgi:putative ABC transport system permease protein
MSSQSSIRAGLLRLANLFRKRKLDGDLSAELESHLQFHIDDNLRAGMSPEEARRNALLKLGGLQQTTENYRDQRTSAFLESLWRDFSYGSRQLAKSPSFTCVAILTLALGIGANTAIFSFVAGTLLRPFPYRESDRLVQLWSSEPQRGWMRNIVSPSDFYDWKKVNRSFEDLAGYIDITANLSGGREAVVIPGLSVTPNFFTLLGVAPRLGQSFRAGDELPGAAPVAIISEGLWKQRFASDPLIVGKSIRLDSTSYTILGVMPSSSVLQLEGAPTAQFWTPYTIDPTLERGIHAMYVIGRLAPGVSTTRAQQEMTLIASDLEREYPKSNAGWTVLVESLRDSLVGTLRPVLFVLTGAVACVLLIACVNIANLQLSRGSARQREIALRGALGAGRLRLVRQLLAESFLLALAAGALGTLLANFSVNLLVRLYFAEDPAYDAVHLDARVLLFTIAISVITVFLSGLAPAFLTSNVKLESALRESSRGSGISGKAHRMRSALVAAECGLAMLLLVGAGLLIRTFVALNQINPGLNPHNVLTFELSLSGPRYKDAATRVNFYDRFLERIASLPGVETASLVTRPPFDGYNGWGFVTSEDPSPPPDQAPDASYQVISPDYFRVLQIPIVEGRAFLPSDQKGSAPVAIISQTTARTYWNGKDPLGMTLNPDPQKFPWMTIVGIVGDVRRRGLDADADPEVFVPYRQYPWQNTPRSFVVRSSVEPVSLTNSIRHIVSEIDSEQAIDNPRTMEQVIRFRSLSGRSFNMVLLGSLAGIALVLAVVGIFGVISYSVSQRTAELGVRMALGARPADILKLVLIQGFRIAALGISFGILASLVLTQTMSSLLFRVSALDPLTFSGVAILLVAVTLLASYLPARRASKVDPMVALRYE